jgi:hypothetical protein
VAPERKHSWTCRVPLQVRQVSRQLRSHLIGHKKVLPSHCPRDRDAHAYLAAILLPRSAAYIVACVACTLARYALTSQKMVGPKFLICWACFYVAPSKQNNFRTLRHLLSPACLHCGRVYSQGCTLRGAKICYLFALQMSCPAAQCNRAQQQVTASNLVDSTRSMLKHAGFLSSAFLLTAPQLPWQHT